MMSKTSRMLLLVVVIVVALSTSRHIYNHHTNTQSSVLTPESGLSQAWDSLQVAPVMTAPVAEYDRSFFGQRWSDDVEVPLGHNGCDTRNDILARDLESVRFKPRTRDCVVLSGVLHDRYSGQTVEFRRGQGTSELVQIDHIVSLANAWYAGAYGWSDEQRRNFANDPLNLVATTQVENQDKKAKTIDQWLPQDAEGACFFAEQVLKVKYRYKLSVTESEKKALAVVLDRCGKD